MAGWPHSCPEVAMGSLVLVELVLAASHTLEAGEVSLYSQQMEVAVDL